MRLTITAFALALAATAAACTVYPSEPASPTYAADVHPIFMAHCARCHGGGGMLRKEIVDGGESTSPSGMIDCYLDRYEDRGDCTLDDAGPLPATCQQGAHTCATTFALLMKTYIHVGESNPKPMPPPPSPPLNEWELNVVDRWIVNGAPP